MRIVISKNGVPVRITNERLRHIFKNHPELASEANQILETIKNPDVILEGDFGELLAAKLFRESPVSKNKYLVVAYKEINQVDGFVLTAYFARRLSKRRKILWKP
jgi:DNA integrity scanning protein DisA with diadenylate cyclase activity